MAALSAKRNGPPGTRVTLVDSWLIGRTGHTAFSNAWTIVALPGDDIDGILHEIVAGNDGIADQVLVRQSLIDSARAAARISRRWGCTSAATRRAPTSAGRRAGLDLARVMYPEGGGLEFAWKLRLALEAEGVQLIDRLFITGLMRGGSRPHHRRGRHQQPHRRVQRHQGARDDRRHQRHHLPLGLRARHHRHRHAAGLSGRRGACATPSSPTCGRARRSSISRASPSRSRRARAGSTPRAKRSWTSYEPEWGDEADVPRIAARHGDGKPQGQHAALSRHVADPRAPARVFHPEQGANGWTISSASSATRPRPTCSARRRITRSTR